MKLVLLFAIAFVCAVAHANRETVVIREAKPRWISRDVVQVLDFDRRQPPVVTFAETTKIKSCTFDGSPCPPDLKMSLLPEKGRPRPRSFALKWTDDQGAHDVSVRILQRIPADFKVEGESVLAEHLYLAYTNVLLALSPKGEVDFYRELPFTVIDFKPNVVGGKTFYSYGEVLQYNDLLNTQGKHWVLDDRFSLHESIDEVFDDHEFVFMGKGHYLYTSYEAITRPDGKCQLVQAAVERKNGKTNYRVDNVELARRGLLPPFMLPTEKMGLVGGSQFEGRECEQSGHLNAITIIDPNRWLLSFGDSTVIMWLKKEKRPEWVFGGVASQFPLSEAQKPSFFHTPRWFPKESRLILFDNGISAKKSRILDYVLDVKRKKVIEMKETSLGDTFALAAGSVERNGDVLSIGTGRWTKGDWDFIEMKEGKPTMRIRICPECKAGEVYRIYRGSFPR